MRLFGKSNESAEAKDRPGTFLLLGVFALIDNDFFQKLGKQILLVRQGKYLDGCYPEQHCKQLRVEDFQHTRVELEEVDLGKLPHMVVDDLRKTALEILKQVDHQGSTTSEVELSRILTGSFFVQLADEVKQKADQVVFKWLIVWLVHHK